MIAFSTWSASTVGWSARRSNLSPLALSTRSSHACVDLCRPRRSSRRSWHRHEHRRTRRQYQHPPSILGNGGNHVGFQGEGWLVFDAVRLGRRVHNRDDQARKNHSGADKGVDARLSSTSGAWLAKGTWWFGTTPGPLGSWKRSSQSACRHEHDRTVRHPSSSRGRGGAQPSTTPQREIPRPQAPTGRNPLRGFAGSDVRASLRSPPALRRGSRHLKYGSQRPMKSASCNSSERLLAVSVESERWYT